LGEVAGGVGGYKESRTRTASGQAIAACGLLAKTGTALRCIPRPALSSMGEYCGI